MRLVVARCSVDYVGRLEAHLPSAVRLLMVKADGSVMVHADGGAYKPLNWMNPPNVLVEGDGPLGGPLAQGRVAHHHHQGGAGRPPPRPGPRPRAAEGRRRGPPPAAAGRRPVCAGARAAPGAAGVPHRHRPGRPAVPGSRRASPWPSRSSAGAEMDGVEQLARYLERLNLDPGCARSGACWRPRPSPPGPGAGRGPGHRAASSSTTTSCGAPGRRTSRCSDCRPPASGVGPSDGHRVCLLCRYPTCSTDAVKDQPGSAARSLPPLQSGRVGRTTYIHTALPQRRRCRPHHLVQRRADPRRGVRRLPAADPADQPVRGRQYSSCTRRPTPSWPATAARRPSSSASPARWRWASRPPPVSSS